PLPQRFSGFLPTPEVARRSGDCGIESRLSPRFCTDLAPGQRMTNPRSAYDELVRLWRERSLLGSCSALLGWDEHTFMPRGGATPRSEQLALLAGMLHERATDPRIAELLGIVEGSDLVADPEAPTSANAREWRRQFDRQTRLPRSLVEELARATSL